MLAIVETKDFRDDVHQQIHWYLHEASLDDVLAIELVERFSGAIEDTLEFLAHTPGAGRPRVVRFSDLTGYRGHRVFEPFGRFRIYYRILGKELHAERLLEGHRLAASDNR
jgi:hypothetical protein